mmetsp:Transcript_23137/g.64991  ORF Transcript_23137/g.64991 Transcript_23137/m.64991 type:complete len:163 (-) Transcript_23137:90-578(-)|eukprot:CAMPEP_0119134938 /NCGR_PEP_ID=MMETSP1310-20130426/18290_1 /TAXON_ID=464262 /ORGANISM="Genus nov. species nov., Strain RCC2339" /LENGTH=162 /DNA_ID=CAMNT_0007125783 /DNA_START=65 /DNA_END=553 /DNA_ORIENTATION=+
MSLAAKRLASERKQWRKDKPFGFHARPETNADGSTNLMRWQCCVPGKEGTPYEGCNIPVTMRFDPDYPRKPPKCQLPAGFWHPNIYPSGTVCLSILNEDEAWSPAITFKQILLGIQELLDNPNPKSPAQPESYQLFERNRDRYDARVVVEAKKYRKEWKPPA